MRETFSPVFEAAPTIDCLVASAIRYTCWHLEWSYYHPDDSTIDGRHMRVRFAPRQHFRTSIKVFEKSRPIRGGHFMFDGTPSMSDVVRSIERNQDIYFSEKRALSGTLEERAAARVCLEAGFHHPGVFRDAWTMPSDDHNVLFYIRTPRHNQECDDEQFIVTDSNGSITGTGSVEAGAAHGSGTHRMVTFATTLEDALEIVRNGEIQPQSGDNDPGLPKWLPMHSREWARSRRFSETASPKPVSRNLSI